MRVDEMGLNLIHSVTTLTRAILKQDEINNTKSYDLHVSVDFDTV